MLVPAFDQPVSAVHHIVSSWSRVSQYHADTRQACSPREACRTPFGAPVDPDV